MHRKRYFPADLEPYPLHYAALRGNVDKVREFLTTTGTNPYEPIQDGETALHVALAENQPEVADILIETFRKDFALVGEYLVEKFLFDPEDKFWLNRSILVATTKEQCEKVKQLEKKFGHPVGSLKEGILVLLKNPVGEEHAALFESNKNNRCEFIKFVKTLFSNGLLSWNNAGPTGKCDTLLIMAAYHGHVKQLESLVNYGADLSIAGPRNQLPFHAACDASQQKIIEVLLNKYINKFNPLILDFDCLNGLHYIMYQKNKESFAPTLTALIEYAVNHCSVSESKAFNKIFNVENENWPHFSLWCQLDCNFWKQLLEVVCEKYEYDLTYHWKECTVLLDMIQFKKVRSYYQKQIRHNPELVNISKDGFTALHMLMSSNELELVKDLYNRMDEQVKVTFECDAAFGALSTIMKCGHSEMLEFILENHCDFLRNNLKKIDEKVIQEYCTPTIEDVFKLLLKYIPDSEKFVLPRRAYLTSISALTHDEFSEILKNLRDDFPSALAEIKKIGKTLDDFSTSFGSLFLSAVIDDFRQLVENLLNANVDIDFLNSEGRHAIHYVQSIEMLNLLVRKHPDGKKLVNRKDRNGFTLLHTLCTSSAANKEELVVELLKLGAKIDECTNDQATALYYTYDEQLFHFLTKGVQEHGFTGIDVHHRDFEGNTALHRHLRHLNCYIARIMLQNADSFVDFNDNGESLLACLVHVNRQTFDLYFKSVLEEHEDKTKRMFEAELEKSKERASQIFVETNLNVFLFERMLEMDLDFNAQGHNGKTALLAVLEFVGWFPVNLVNQLLDKGVDVNIQDVDGRNALLMTACNFDILKSQEGGLEMVKKVISRGVDLDRADAEGNTALHYACKIVDFDLIDVLVESGANCRIKNKKGRFCYQMAHCDLEIMLASLLKYE